MTERAAPRLSKAAEVSLQLLLVAAGVLAVGFVLVQLRLVVIPVIGALFLATLLVPPAHWLRRRGWPGFLATIAVMLVAGVVLAGLSALIGPPLANELGDLGDRAREGLAEVGSWLGEGPLGVSEREVDDAIDTAVDRLRDNSGSIASGVVSGAVLVAEIVAGVLLTVVLTFFFVKDGGRIWGWVVDLSPRARRDQVREIGRRSWSTLTSYVRGVAVVALVDSTLIGIALLIIGVPLVLPLAVLTFLASFFPLVGAVAAGMVAALVALVSEGVLAALLVTLAIVIVQQLDGDVVFPFVVGRAIRLHPVAILLALTGGGVIGGLVGAFVAVPTAAVIWSVVSYFREVDEASEDPPAAGEDAAGSPGAAAPRGGVETGSGAAGAGSVGHPGTPGDARPAG